MPVRAPFCVDFFPFSQSNYSNTETEVEISTYFSFHTLYNSSFVVVLRFDSVQSIALTTLLTLRLTYLLTPWSRVLLEKLTSKLCS